MNKIDHIWGIVELKIELWMQYNHTEFPKILLPKDMHDPELNYRSYVSRMGHHTISYYDGEDIILVAERLLE